MIEMDYHLDERNILDKYIHTFPYGQRIWFRDPLPSVSSFPEWILEVLKNVKEDDLRMELGYYLRLLDGTLKEMGMGSPSYFIDEEERDIEFLWENDRFRLLLNFDWEYSTAISILRIKSERREKVIEIEADPFSTIQCIRRLVVPSLR